MPPASVKRTKIRFTAGSNGTAAPEPLTKMPKVAVELAAIAVVTLDEAVLRHRPVPGLVWQIVTVTGTLAVPVSAEAVMDPAAPTFAVATEKAPVAVVPGTTTTPLLVTVA